MVQAPVVAVDVGAVDGGEKSAPVAVRESGFVGRWTGVGRQDDGQSWPMIVNLTGTEGECARVEYPSIPCKAVWLCEGESEGVLRARERLVDDKAHRCVDDGEMEMQIRDGRLHWSWSAPDQSASATLAR